MPHYSSCLKDGIRHLQKASMLLLFSGENSRLRLPKLHFGYTPSNHSSGPVWDISSPVLWFFQYNI